MKIAFGLLAQLYFRWHKRQIITWTQTEIIAQTFILTSHKLHEVDRQLTQYYE